MSTSRSAMPPLPEEHLRAAPPALRALDERLAQALTASITVATRPPGRRLLADCDALHFLLATLDAERDDERASVPPGTGAR